VGAVLIARRETERSKAVSVRLPESVLALLDRYAAHVNADRSYVVTEALRIVFREDREFAEQHGLAAPRRTRRAAEAAV
jgi:predicted transcriptional regulator